MSEPPKAPNIAVAAASRKVGSRPRLPNADAAWHYLTAGGACDIVVSDIQMPGSLDGIALTRCVRTRFPHLPIVLMSGRLSAEDAKDADAFLQKPQREGVLAATIERLLDTDGRLASRTLGNG